MRIEREQFDEAEARISLLTDISAQHGFDGFTDGGDDPADRPGRHPGSATGADVKDLALHASVLFEMTEIWKQFDTRFFLPYYLMVAGVLYAGAGDKRTAQRLSRGFAASGRRNRHEVLAVRDPAPPRPSRTPPSGKGGEAPGQPSCWPGPSRPPCSSCGRRWTSPISTLGTSDEVDRALGHLGRDASYPEVALAEAVLGTVA